ncbi:hypothetical protein QIS74_13594 [Colletotrichum tabaci]|uniref:Uncharacterized protein n=1 Tax=Colletotrichum tabaci TaxID=1209068 RepID=A0AAV9SSD9_9PEZI
MEPIDILKVPLLTICLDFLVSLPMSKQGHDSLLLLTDKTAKFIRAIQREERQQARDAANADAFGQTGDTGDTWANTAQNDQAWGTQASDQDN